MRLLIVRHGKPEGADSVKRFLGRTDEALSAEGLEQAHELGRTIAKRETERNVVIVSSPLKRSQETAAAIREHVGCGPIVTDDDLSEIDMGAWDGRCFDEIRQEYPEEYMERGGNLWNYKVPEGESFAETGARFKRAIERIIEQQAEADTVIVVSHAGAIRAGLSLITDTPFDEWMKRDIPYTSSIILEDIDEADKN